VIFIKILLFSSLTAINVAGKTPNTENIHDIRDMMRPIGNMYQKLCSVTEFETSVFYAKSKIVLLIFTASDSQYISTVHRLENKERRKKLD